ncbi:hypothetical protein, partial [Pseudomonas syringae group genomosp. 3]|uniref:hypothetical protein n=1 Tax=Pseudomonas syringae group genomosp. 3 TaxID=251701 RepID=UPI001F29D8C7
GIELIHEGVDQKACHSPDLKKGQDARGTQTIRQSANRNCADKATKAGQGQTDANFDIAQANNLSVEKRCPGEKKPATSRIDECDEQEQKSGSVVGNGHLFRNAVGRGHQTIPLEKHA